MLGGAGRLEWRVVDNVTLRVSLACVDAGEGWLAVGLGQQMAGSVVVIARPGTARRLQGQGTPAVAQYALGAGSEGGVAAQLLQDQSGVSDASVVREGGAIVLAFSASSLGGEALNTSGADSIVLAHGPGADQLLSHGESSRARQVLTVDWTRDYVAETQAPSPAPTQTAVPSTAPFRGVTVTRAGDATGVKLAVSIAAVALLFGGAVLAVRLGQDMQQDSEQEQRPELALVSAPLAVARDSPEGPRVRMWPR